ncbi:MAG: ATP-dependent DNA helicase RecG [Candidatus Liptonbacteria bacterium]|nr:ATP-dependent DNA helicase RecG [Candidatus Liptonbacteria bacterium]
MGLTLQTPLYQIKGIPPRFLKRLERLKIFTVKDLLWHFPSRYEDFSEVIPIGNLEPGQQVTVEGIIRDIKLRRSFRRRFVIVEARIADDSGEIKAVWFNQPYLLNTLRPGQRANFAGKVSLGENEIYLSHPAYELISARMNADDTQISADTETRHTARLVPVYPETRGLTSKGIRFLVQPILKNAGVIPEWLPEETLEAMGLPEINAALNEVHFPTNEESALAAKKRFSFEDLFLLQLTNLRHKMKLAKEKAPPLKADIGRVKEIIGALPFELTVSQKKSLWEIIQDMGKARPMNRLLQGDVGSGKTVVAAIAALLAAESVHQSAFMAPTEILARQHFSTLKKIFAALPMEKQPEVGLLVSKEAKIFYENDLETEVSKAEFKKKAESGTVKIVVGTHALIQNDVAFKNLGLVIVDEQHRFGVAQRQALVRGKKTLPHFLSMSATPIPRTLMLTVFGDLDISIITELPSGRKPIITKIVAPANRYKAYQFIREQIKKGRQAFVICPRIEPSETKSEEPGNGKSYSQKIALWEVKSVKEEYEKLSKNVFPDLRVEMLHGQMPAFSGHKKKTLPGIKSKAEIMKDFAAGKIDILVSTSVIEVGVDVPNSTIMMIEGADRFGLAQLYQFRGRVGRGYHQSFCFLFTDSSAKTANERLKAIIEAKNGFELAEKDLKMRGPGEFIGQKQTGLPDVAMRGLQDFELIKSSREAAVKALEKDKNLKNNPLLAGKLSEFEERIHQE